MDLTPEARAVVTALVHMRKGFIAAGLPLPVLTLPEHAHGDKLVRSIKASRDYSVLGDVQPLIVEVMGGAWWQIELVGVKVRWPALRVAKRDGAYAWEYV